MRHTPIAALGILLLAACSVQEADTTARQPAPSPTAETTDVTASPTPSSEPTATAAPTPTPYGVAVFDDPDSCVNEEIGYRVAFPESWYYNTAYADFEACRFFHPEFFEVADDAEPETAISFRAGEGLAIGVVAIYTIESQEETTVDGRPAVRWEVRGLPGGPEGPGYLGPNDYLYNYTFFISDDHSERGPSVTATLSSVNHPDHEENRDVLDRMMETIQIPAGSE